MRGHHRQQQPQPAQQGQQGQGQAPLGGQMGPEQLRAIFNHPQLAAVRRVIRQNPNALQPILAQLAQTAPDIYNVLHLLFS